MDEQQLAEWRKTVDEKTGKLEQFALGILEKFKELSAGFESVKETNSNMRSVVGELLEAEKERLTKLEDMQSLGFTEQVPQGAGVNKDEVRAIVEEYFNNIGLDKMFANKINTMVQKAVGTVPQKKQASAKKNKSGSNFIFYGVGAVAAIAAIFVAFYFTRQQEPVYLVTLKPGAQIIVEADKNRSLPPTLTVGREVKALSKHFKNRYRLYGIPGYEELDIGLYIPEKSSIFGEQNSTVQIVEIKNF